METGWGRSVEGNNLFGIKDTSILPGYVKFKTKEYVKGEVIILDDEFESFSSPLESIVFYLYLIKTHPRYRKVWKSRKKPKKYFEELQK